LIKTDINFKENLNSKFIKYKNIFFVSAESKYFQKEEENKGTLDFIQQTLFKYSFFNDSENIYFLDSIEDYIDFIKFSKTEQKLIDCKKKRSGNS